MLFISRTTTRFISLRRSFSSGQIRVRFAPSPTGKLHIGGLRTALYNYLFARKHNGLFILRIEDTDQERLKPESLPNIYESLKWAGIEPDYGPHNQNDKKSDLGPLMQSQRLSLYQTHADQLLSSGKAYRCFCDPSRLELLRKNATKRQEKIGYDGKCRHLSPSQIEKLLGEKRPFVIRFKFEQTNGVDREIAFEDMAMGIHKSSPGKQEGDFIILKSDRFPTYHFANVVDDHLMKISHVLRGQEWLLSTAKHILIYEAFGWKHPIYAHLPLICNSDGSKISKRQNDIDVMSYQSRGYLPETLLSYLTTIGGGCKTQIAEDERFFADFTHVRENLVRNFDEAKISNRPVKLNQELLDNMNRWFLKSMLPSQQNRLKLIENLQSLLRGKYPNINEYYLNEKYLRTVLECSLDRIHRINELVDDPKFAYLWNDVLTSINCDAIKNSPRILLDVIEKLKARLKDEEDFVESKLHANISEIFNEVKKRSESKINFWKLTRLVLTGSENGPPLAEIFYILGKENSIYRLNLAIDIISKNHI